MKSATARIGQSRTRECRSTSGKSVAAPATIYNSQAGSIIFACGLVFKASSLPGLVAQDLSEATLVL